MSGLKRILSNSSWMAGEQVVRLLVGLFVGIWIARHLGPANFGALSFAISFCSLVGIFAALGLNRILIRELTLNARDKAVTSRLVNSVLGIRIFVAIACFLLALSVSLVANQGDPLLVGFIAFGFIFSAFDVIDLNFQARTQSKIPVLARSTAFFLVSGIKILLLLQGAGVVAFAVVTTFEVAISAVGLIFVYRLEGFSLHLRHVDLRYGFSLLKESWPEIFAGFACLVFMRIDQVMLGNMVGQEAVGIYSVASRLAEAWYFIPTALVASSFPAIVRQREVDHALYMRRLHQLMAALVAMAYAAGVVVMVAAEWLIPRLYGVAYTESAMVLVILVWCGVFVCLGTASGSWIMAERRPILNLTRNVSGAMTNVGFNLVLIPKYGVVGAAYGTLLSQIIAYFASDFFNPVTRPIGRMKLKSLFFIWK